MKQEIIVIKYGGAAMQSIELIRSVMQDIATLQAANALPILVHGGGPEISKMCEQVGIVSQFSNGLRITDKETVKIVQMVLAGKINKDLVLHLQQHGIKAVGLCGIDTGLFTVTKTSHPTTGSDLGFVGTITAINTEILYTLLTAGYVPIIAPIAASTEGEVYNVNADDAASHLAVALQAHHLLFLTDTPGILRNLQDPESTIPLLQEADLSPLTSAGILTGGMLPKAQGACSAIKAGVNKVHILDGRKPHSLLLHLQGLEQRGTTFV